MNSAEDLRRQLSLTQQDMATLLGISRSHYTMYITGKRSLPVHAIQTLAGLFKQAQPTAQPLKKASQQEADPHQPQLLQHLQRLQHKNEFRLLVVEKKLAAAAKKPQAGATAALLTDYLATDAAGTTPRKTEGTQLVISKFSRQITAAETAKLAALEIKKEVLEFERSLLAAKVAAAVKAGTGTSLK